MKKSLLTLGLLALTSKTNAGLLYTTKEEKEKNSIMLTEASKIVEDNKSNITETIPYSDEITNRNSLIKVIALTAPQLITLPQILSSLFAVSSSKPEPASQTFTVTKEIDLENISQNVFVLQFAALTALTYLCIKPLLEYFLTENDIYQTKKQLYMDLQKVHRIKIHQAGAGFQSLQESNWGKIENWTYYETLKIATILNFTYETFFYRFEKIDKKIELLKKSIDDCKISRYID